MSIEQRNSDASVNIALDTILIKKQCIIFVNTKRSAESVAEKLSQIISKDKKHNYQSHIDLKQLEDLSSKILKIISPPTKQCHRLSDLLKYGIAFHHSGLVSEQRKLVEENFKLGIIKIIVATPTLAMGLDLPAFRVIIRDLKRFGNWGMQYIPVLEYEQQCLPAGTTILTKDGQRTIDSIVNSTEQVYVLSYNEKKCLVEYKLVTQKYSRKTTSLITLNTDYGFSLKITPDHPVCINRDGLLKWIPAKNILVDDSVLFSNNCFNLQDNNYDVLGLIPVKGVYVVNSGQFILALKKHKKFSDSRVAKLLDMLKKNIYHYKYDKKSLSLESVFKICDVLDYSLKKRQKEITCVKSKYGEVLNLTSLLDTEFFWLVGLIATDGTLTSTKDKRTGSRYVRIKISNNNIEIIKRAQEILKKLCGGECYLCKRGDGNYSLEKGHTLLADILKNNFGIPHNKKSLIVETPKLLDYLDNKYVGAYLTGVFDGDGSYSPRRRVLFVTGSEKFVSQIQKLLLRIGIISSMKKIINDKMLLIKGKLAKFVNPSYIVCFSQIDKIKRFNKLSKVTKSDLHLEYSKYNNINKYHSKKIEFEFLKISSVVKCVSNERVYNIGVRDNENYFANNFLVHNCGRAGRPSYDNYGEAICLAKDKSEKQEIYDQYITGLPEPIVSKLAVEPIMRTYILSLIASEFIRTSGELEDFFEETFYAKHYGDTEKLKKIIHRMTDQLEEWGFVNVGDTEKDTDKNDKKENKVVEKPTDFVSALKLAYKKKGGKSDGKSGDSTNEKLSATLVGHRVSELYLDPYTAHEIIQSLELGLKKKSDELFNSYSIMHLVCNCLELRPLLRTKSKEVDDFVEKMALNAGFLLMDVPDMFDESYEEFLNTIKTTEFFMEWLDEKDEEYLLEKYDIRPGELHAKKERADWLLYSSEELSKLLKMQVLMKDIVKLRFRLKYGAKEELIPLLQLKNIGRIRARKMYNNKIRDIADVKRVDITTLSQLLGKTVAIDIKKQVGQEHSEEKVVVKENKRKGQINLDDY